MSACPLADGRDRCYCDEPHDYDPQVPYNVCECGRPREHEIHGELP